MTGYTNPPYVYVPPVDRILMQNDLVNVPSSNDVFTEQLWNVAPLHHIGAALSVVAGIVTVNERGVYACHANVQGTIHGPPVTTGATLGAILQSFTGFPVPGEFPYGRVYVDPVPGNGSGDTQVDIEWTWDLFPGSTINFLVTQFSGDGSAIDCTTQLWVRRIH